MDVTKDHLVITTMDVAEFFGLSFYYAYATATVAAAWAAADAVADATMTVAITAVKVLSS